MSRKASWVKEIPRIFTGEPLIKETGLCLVELASVEGD